MYFAFYEHYIHTFLFYTIIIFAIVYSTTYQYGQQSIILNYILTLLIILKFFFFYFRANYGIDRIVPKVDRKLDESETIVPQQTIMQKDIDSGRGYTVYIEFYPILHSTNFIYTITSKNQQYSLVYDPNSGSLIIKVVASNDNGIGGFFDNVFKISNLPMQRKNRLLMNVNQEIVTVYLNSDQYSFNMTGMPRIVSSNIYVGQNNGLKGDLTRYMYLDFPITNLQSKRLMNSMKLRDRYIMGFVPVM